MPLDLFPWQSGPERPEVEDDTLHLWRFSLVSTPPYPQTLPESVLSVDELERSERLITPTLKTRFIAGRTYLRWLLARYLSTRADSISFHYNDYGKPILAGPHCESLYFNLAHSGNNAVLLVSKEKMTGVDLEIVDFKINYKEIAMRYFTQDEKRLFSALPDLRQRRLFYRLWTLKESRIKAYGKGLADLPEQEVEKDGLRSRQLYAGNDQVCCLTFPNNIARIRRFSEPE